MFIEKLQKQTILPVLRYHSQDLCATITKAFLECQWDVVEVTMTTPGALEVINQYSEAENFLGAGSIKSLADAKMAQDAGAKFLVSPGFSLEIASYAQEAKLPYFPGVATASEVMSALGAGCQHLKLFPADQLGGPSFLKALKGPFPEVSFLPTGGIHLLNYMDYLEAGAFAVGIGGSLIPQPLLENGNLSEIISHIQSLTQS